MKNLKYIIFIIALVISINTTSAQIGNNNSEVECDVTPVKTVITKIPVTPTIPNVDPPTDTDVDGLPDSEEFDENCTHMFYPDSDGDGIPDGEDECPCSPDPNCEEEIRKIFFVHGYTPTNGSTACSRVQTLTQSTYDNIQTHNFNYSSLQLSLDQAANAVRQEIEAIIPDLHNPNKTNFVIAHSLGGMVMRNIEDRFTSGVVPYDGVISFRVGHNGVYASETSMLRETKFTEIQ
jgi:hypothetical protein